MYNSIKNIEFYHVAIIVASLLMSASFIFYWIAIDVLRYISILLLVLQIWNEIRFKDKLFLTSPLFLLSSCSLIFFSFLQGVSLNLFEPGAFSRVLIAIGSDAERYIAAFGCVLLAAHILVSFIIKMKPKIEKREKIADNHLIYNFFILFIIILTFVNIYYFHTVPDPAAVLNVSLRHFLPPLQTFMLLLLIRKSFINGERFGLLAVLFFCIIFGGMFAVHEGKIPILFGAIVMLYCMRLIKLSIKKVFFCCFIIFVIGIVGLQLTSVMRSPEGSMGMFISGTAEKDLGDNNLPKFLKTSLKKAVHRQTDTIYCLNGVLNHHSEDFFILSKQFFWLEGLVPRIIWPEKPSLSMGKIYTLYYCVSGQNPNHHSSVTLLGQPFIMGGNIGLFLNIGLLIIGLAGITWLTREPLSLSTLSVVALSPWLIDMDQHFILYVANAVKFFCVILPIVIIVGFSEKTPGIMRLMGILKPRIGRVP